MSTSVLKSQPEIQTTVAEPVQSPRTRRKVLGGYVAIILIAAATYLGCIISPPALMDDVDAVQAQIARTMLASGDWVTARLDGILYLEKAPLIYWLIAGSYKVFGVHDWAARIPVALAAIALCWLTAMFGVWAFGRRAGFYAGLSMATCAGLFLFTRILIPDVILTLTIAIAMWAFLRILEDQERHTRAWSLVIGASIGAGLLLKGLVAAAFPIGAGLLYLLLTKQLFSRSTWKRLHSISIVLVALAVAVPWHVLATLRNPPYFAFTLRSGPGQYHGFLWFYFINEQLLRFLNMRYPRDYNTVPRLWFWLFHLLWLFPWSVYLPAVAKLSFKPLDRAGRVRLFALCWAGVVLVFFTFSTTQEYYSMPCYPAFALLLGSAMATGGAWIRRGTRALSILTAAAAAMAIGILILVRNVPAPGDISSALSGHPGLYTLSLGHIEDLTLAAFAYLRLPLVLAALAFMVGTLGTLKTKRSSAFLASAVMMVLFFQAARLALVVFDPYMSSRPLTETLLRSPKGELIVDHHYYTFSSVFFYTNRTALLLNGRRLNLEYGSNAPGAPPIFIDDAQFKNLWNEDKRYYLVAEQPTFERMEKLVGPAELNVVTKAGGKYLLTNHPI